MDVVDGISRSFPLTPPRIAHFDSQFEWETTSTIPSSHLSEMKPVPHWLIMIQTEQELLTNLDQIAWEINRDRNGAPRNNDTKIYRFRDETLVEIPSEYGSKQIGLSILNLMREWYDEDDIVYKGQLNIIDSIILISQQGNHITIKRLWEIHRLINKYAIISRKHKNEENLVRLLEYLQSWLFFEPYLEIIDPSKQLKYIKKLGAGSHALVVLVKYVKRYYALKLMKVTSKSCIDEEYILNHIHNQSILYSLEINVPKITHYLDGIYIDCKYYNAILMQYIHGSELSKIGISDTTSMISSLLSEISITIINLIKIGIGHFDINSDNIIRDMNGKWWLIDFGLAKIYNNMYSNKAIIGTWKFYSNYAYKLEMIRQKILNQRKHSSNGHNHNAVISRDTFNSLTVKANLFSLQMNLIYKLSKDNPLQFDQLAQTMDEQHIIIAKRWNSQNIVDRGMYFQLKIIWDKAKCEIKNYLQSIAVNRNITINQQMFDLILEEDTLPHSPESPKATQQSLLNPLTRRTTVQVLTQEPSATTQTSKRRYIGKNCKKNKDCNCCVIS